MEPVPFVVDISSDDEEEEEEKRKRRRLEEKVDMSSIDYEWMKGIKGFLEMGDEEQNQVALLGKAEHETKILKEGDDDDDCVILEGDPEKFVTSVNDSATGSDSDELLVVGEKGQIACRDYPHPRHLCGNFPYSSTPHQRYCSQCHCYVCDSPAPCPKWGTGLASADHCHATDKFEVWKTLRQSSKLPKTASLAAPTTLGKTASLAVPTKLGMTSFLAAPTNCGSLGDVVNFQHNHTNTMPLDIMKLSPNSMFLNQPSRPSPPIHTHSLENSIPQDRAFRQVLLNQLAKLNTVPLCSTASNFTTSNGVNHGTYQESESTMLRNMYQSHSDPRGLLGVSNHAIQRETGLEARSLRPVSSHVMSNGTGLGARSLRPVSSHVMSNGVSNLGFGNNLTMNQSTNGASGFTNHVNPAPQYDRYHAAPGFSNSRTCFESAYEPLVYYLSNDIQDFYGNCIQDNAGPPSSYMAHLNRNQHLYEPQVGTQSKLTLGNIPEYGATRQDGYLLRPHDEIQSEYSRMAGFAAFDPSWIENASNSISGLQSSGSMNIPIPPCVEESSPQFKGSTTNHSVGDTIHWPFDEN